jgi:rfaE bifunctional protein nucleotidyltransferase chain/domain
VLHLGHVRYLEAARALGDVLAVAVNGDRSVRRLKGPNRPITGEQDRAAVVAALEAVDLVTIFHEDTAESLVKEICPAVYVKGGDYSSDPASESFPVEGHVVLRQGGEVRVVGYVPGRSSTDTLQRLQAEGPS